MFPGIERSERVSTRLPLHRRYLPISKGSDAPTPEPGWTGLFPGEPRNAARDIRKFLSIYAHLGILLLVCRQYRIEGRGFELIAQVAFFGLPIHYLLPYRFKQTFFIALSLVGLTWVWGPAAALWVAAGLAACVGICFLPIPWIARAASVAGFGAAILAARALGFTGGIPETVVPLLGSMMMFRSIIFLYELKHAKKPESVLDAVGYFCMLPNFCFLHFPVVDYRTLQRSCFGKEIHATQQSGLRMIFRGIVHLLVYRLIYHELATTPSDVRDFPSLLFYLVCNYGLYLHVSGQFHIACGLMQLYGYSLPETHSRFFLAAGFTDYWRRINIYWKDFMVRLVFHPIAFRLKRRPAWQSLSAATACVFLVTWILHAYQSYWLLGSWRFSTPDTLFWAILGGLVLVNVQIDARSNRAAASRSRGAKRMVIHGLQVAATFATITILWSLWSSPTVGDWVAMFRRGLTF
ncbi:MAG: hypothetical protein SFX72_00975 [Isosphaeraceae bacterium]|nr:hypothetical protein [Isosphaeraceae bacterium]